MEEENKITDAEIVSEKTEQEKFQERVQIFFLEYGELVKKHDIDFATYPMFVPDNNGGFRIVCQNTPVDIKGQPIKSPFVSKSE